MNVIRVFDGAVVGCACALLWQCGQPAGALGLGMIYLGYSTLRAFCLRLP